MNGNLEESEGKEDTPREITNEEAKRLDDNIEEVEDEIDLDRYIKTTAAKIEQRLSGIDYLEYMQEVRKKDRERREEELRKILEKHSITFEYKKE
ncbi:hypothetical protein [Sporosarcina cyprini]|uniref:hypothetical protein n=1 Tax=Sporosarcina cyprini TaxID=2910523 RepID=UPI001EE1509B|nr:hypothetical protein [Sporosarcina cyprini]MCG3088514.1 hypothetical protein [Sporosarcina cyprini]